MTPEEKKAQAGEKADAEKKDATPKKKAPTLRRATDPPPDKKQPQ